MSVIGITMFSKIQISVPEETTLTDINVSISNETRSIDLELELNSYTTTLDNRLLTLKPDGRWLPGSRITLEINGSIYQDQYYVNIDKYYYDPEQFLYSKGLLDTANSEDLINTGLATLEEISLITSMGPKLAECFDKVTKLLYARLTYDNTEANSLVIRVVGFRRMQQLAFMYGLDAIVESILFSPGPAREWFRQADIAGVISDYDVLENLPSVSKSVSELRNSMTLNNLNTDIISSIDYQIDASSEYNTLAKFIVTIFCGVRYTHDNTKFSY